MVNGMLVNKSNKSVVHLQFYTQVNSSWATCAEGDLREAKEFCYMMNGKFPN